MAMAVGLGLESHLHWSPMAMILSALIGLAGTMIELAGTAALGLGSITRMIYYSA